jgi:hypothetical protein
MIPQAYKDISSDDLLRQRQLLLRRKQEFTVQLNDAEARQAEIERILTDRKVSLAQKPEAA